MLGILLDTDEKNLVWLVACCTPLYSSFALRWLVLLMLYYAAVAMSTEGLLFICFISCLRLQSCQGFAICPSTTIHMVRNKLLMAMMIDDGDDGCNEHEEKRSKPFYLGKIPLIAIVFPPIGFIMLIQYLLRKRK